MSTGQELFIKALQLAALMVWIGFVALAANNLFRANVNEKALLVTKCQVAVREKHGIDFTAWYDHHYSDAGSRHHVLPFPHTRD